MKWLKQKRLSRTYNVEEVVAMPASCCLSLSDDFRSLKSLAFLFELAV